MELTTRVPVKDEDKRLLVGIVAGIVTVAMLVTVEWRVTLAVPVVLLAAGAVDGPLTLLAAEEAPEAGTPAVLVTVTVERGAESVPTTPLVVTLVTVSGQTVVETGMTAVTTETAEVLLSSGQSEALEAHA